MIHSKFDIIVQVAFISFAKPPFSSELSSHDAILPNDLLASGPGPHCLVLFLFRYSTLVSIMIKVVDYMQRNRQPGI